MTSDSINLVASQSREESANVVNTARCCFARLNLFAIIQYFISLTKKLVFHHTRWISIQFLNDRCTVYACVVMCSFWSIYFSPKINVVDFQEITLFNGFINGCCLILMNSDSFLGLWKVEQIETWIDEGSKFKN